LFDLPGKRESSAAGIKNKYQEVLAKEIKSQSPGAL
jgi:hypothetical protein